MTVYISRDKSKAELAHYGVKGMKWKHHKYSGQYGIGLTGEEAYNAQMMEKLSKNDPRWKLHDKMKDNHEIIRESSGWQYSKNPKIKRSKYTGDNDPRVSQKRINEWAVQNARDRRKAIESNAKLRKQIAAYDYMPTKGASGTKSANKSSKRGDLISRAKKAVDTFLKVQKRYFSSGGPSFSTYNQPTNLGRKGKW